MCGFNISQLPVYSRNVHRDDFQTLPNSADIAESIKRMYARGDIDRRTFQRLLKLAAQGEIHHGDLPAIGRRLQAAVPDESSELQDLARQADHLRSKARQAAEAALYAQTAVEAEVQLEIQQGALFRLREIEAQIANYHTE